MSGSYPLFVYDEARLGEARRGLLRGTSLGTGRAQGYLALSLSGELVFRPARGTWVTGEILELRPESLTLLDQLRGIGQAAWLRRELSVRTPSGEITCWIYTWDSEDLRWRKTRKIRGKSWSSR